VTRHDKLKARCTREYGGGRQRLDLSRPAAAGGNRIKPPPGAYSRTTRLPVCRLLPGPCGLSRSRAEPARRSESERGPAGLVRSRRSSCLPLPLPLPPWGKGGPKPAGDHAACDVTRQPALCLRRGPYLPPRTAGLGVPLGLARWQVVGPWAIPCLTTTSVFFVRIAGLTGS
jgi:hypothetical protein